MVIRANEQIEIPNVSLPTFLFGSATKELPTDPLFIDAADTSHYLSFATYRVWAQRFAAGLKKRGFRRGERLLVYSTNSIYYVVCYMGTIMAGGIFTGSSPGYTARELSYHIRDSDPAYMLFLPDGYDRGMEAAREAGVATDKNNVFVFDGRPNPPPAGKSSYPAPHWTDILALEEEGRNFRWPEVSTAAEADETVTLNYSSGTTGLPKGVMMSHKTFVANLSQFKHEFDQRPDPITPETTHLCFLPMNHAMAQVMHALGCPAFGGRVYVQEKFDFVSVLRDVERFKVDNLMLVPPIIVAMSQTPLLRGSGMDGKGKIDINSVRTVGTGAAPISVDTLKKFQELFRDSAQGTIVRNAYGMSEATCGITCGIRDGDPALISSVGPALPSMEVKVMAIEDGKEPREVTQRGDAATGGRGELWVRGPNVTKGYWRKPDATAATLTADGWLRTGDVVTIDDRGRVYIVDRIKELIKVKGNQVAPAELEALLLEHPAVADAAVIGVPTPDGDEAPRAYVQLGQGKSATEKEIQDFVAQRVNKNKWLRGGVKFSPEGIPKNPSGKILRKLLREQAAKERKSKL